MRVHQCKKTRVKMLLQNFTQAECKMWPVVEMKPNNS